MQSLSLCRCPAQQKASSACLSRTCSHPPFLCNSSHCNCSFLHSRCKTMRIPAVSDYLSNWQKWLCKDVQDYITRIDRIYGNGIDKLQKEQKIFKQYCKERYLGCDFQKLMAILERRDFSKITAQLLANALEQTSDTPKSYKFQSLSSSEAKKQEQNLKSYLNNIEQLYKLKSPQLQQLPLTRSSSATLSSPSTSTSRSSRLKDENMVSLLKLKTDLSYPKFIDSKILGEATQLNHILGRKVKKYHLCYRASENAFCIEEFYRKWKVISEQMAAKTGRPLMSIIIVRTEFGKTLGGFTSLKWLPLTPQKQTLDSDEESDYPKTHSPDKKHKYRSDPTATTNLFSLDLMQRYDLLKPDEAIYCGRHSIGFGVADLKISGGVGRKSSCRFPGSFNLKSSPYYAGSKSGMGLSGSRYGVSFVIREWECLLGQF